ncbi:MAG: glycosyltransferase [Gammaproteobacteria bacterium]|nr:glycosyltransferase [Gammaproteobacteria bacterium]
MNPLVSIIIPVYNGEEYIEEALKSVLNQTYSPIEIIVVDDGSTDGTAEIVKQYSVILIQQKNKGISGARNSGINAAKGEFIALLDHDDLFTPYKIELQVRFMNDHPKYCMVYSIEEKFSSEGTVRKKLKHRRKKMPENDILTAIYRKNFIYPSSVLIRRSILERTGLFDETFTVCEDHDFFTRVAYHGMVGFINQPLIKYRCHNANISSRLSFLTPSNKFIIFKRYLFMLKEKTLLWPFIYIYQTAKTQRDMGIICIDHKQYVAAKKYLLLSFLKCPWRIKTIRNLFKTFFF